MTKRREIAYALLRITVGVMFLFYGVGKLMMGLDAYRVSLVQQFSNTPLPEMLVAGFGTILPFAEILLGAFLILGMATLPVAVAAQVLLLVLLFGTVILPDPPTVASNILYATVLFGLTSLLEYNRYSLDTLLGIQPRQALAGTPAEPFRGKRPYWGERVERETSV